MSEVGYGNKVRVYGAADGDRSNACGAIHDIHKGKKTHMLLHLKNDKIMYVLSGKVTLYVIEDGIMKQRECVSGESIAISPGLPHQFEALEDSLLVEFGTNPRVYIDGRDTTVVQLGTELPPINVEVDG